MKDKPTRPIPLPALPTAPLRPLSERPPRPLGVPVAVEGGEGGKDHEGAREMIAKALFFTYVAGWVAAMVAIPVVGGYRKARGLEPNEDSIIVILAPVWPVALLMLAGDAVRKALFGLGERLGTPKPPPALPPVEVNAGPNRSSSACPHCGGAIQVRP